MKKLIRILIRGYQICISPVLPIFVGPNAGCRYQPTCSQYFLDAVELHGIFRGSWLGLKRIGRCHPWGGLGWDPVPPREGEAPPECGCEEAPEGKREKFFPRS